MKYVLPVFTILCFASLADAQRTDYDTPKAPNTNISHATTDKVTFEKLEKEANPSSALGDLTKITEQCIRKDGGIGKDNVNGKRGYTKWEYHSPIPATRGHDGLLARVEFLTADGTVLKDETVFSTFLYKAENGGVPADVFFDLFQPRGAASFRITFVQPRTKEKATTEIVAFRKPNP